MATITFKSLHFTQSYIFRHSLLSITVITNIALYITQATVLATVTVGHTCRFTSDIWGEPQISDVGGRVDQSSLMDAPNITVESLEAFYSLG